jgi:large-conductance mechanosensitive channel
MFDNYWTLSVSSISNTFKSIMGIKNLGNVALNELLEIYNIGINTAISTALFSVTSSLSKSLPNLKTDVNKLVNALSAGTNIPSLKAVNPSLDYIGKILKYLQEGMTESALGVMSSYVNSVQTSEPEAFIKTFTPLINGTISSIMNPTISKSITSSTNISLGEGYPLSTFISESIGLQKILSGGSIVGSYTKDFAIYVWEWLAYLFFFPYERVKLNVIEQGGCIIGEPIQEIFTKMVSNSTNPVIETLSTNVEFKNFLNNTAKFACIEQTNVALALNEGRQTIQNKFVPYVISNLNFNYFFIIAIILMFVIALFTADQEDEPQEPQEQQQPVGRQTQVESRFEEIQ